MSYHPRLYRFIESEDELPSPFVLRLWNHDASHQAERESNAKHGSTFNIVHLISWHLLFGFGFLLCDLMFEHFSFVCDWPMYVWKSVWATCGLSQMLNNFNADEFFQMMTELLSGSSLLPGTFHNHTWKHPDPHFWLSSWSRKSTVSPALNTRAPSIVWRLDFSSVPSW